MNYSILNVIKFLKIKVIIKLNCDKICLNRLIIQFIVDFDVNLSWFQVELN